jgi:pimeloyl-ACP methyl ester carboxylesterase
MNYTLDVKEIVSLGGVKQSIRIRTSDETLPVVLFLHGGPGVCDRHWVLKHQSDIAGVATMVCWDQRGAGLSYDKSLKKEDLCVSRMVEDAAQLVAYLCKRFNRDKIIVVGHSWGTLLGTLLAQKHPEHIAAYIGMGQFVDGPENERLSYQFVFDEATKRGDKKALKNLAKIGWPEKGHYKTLDDLMVQRNLMTKYGGEDYGESDGIIKAILIPLLRSPEYRLTDLVKYYKGAFFSLESMWEEIIDFDFNKDVTKLDMPVYLTEGRHDQNTPTQLAQKWFENLSAPHKEWIWFEKSAHSPIKNEPDAWGKTVMRIIRENT